MVCYGCCYKTSTAKRETNYNKFNIRQFFDELGIASRLSETRLNGLKQIEEILHSL